jgi:hypothetical protein
VERKDANPAAPGPVELVWFDLSPELGQRFVERRQSFRGLLLQFFETLAKEIEIPVRNPGKSARLPRDLLRTGSDYARRQAIAIENLVK